MSHTSISSRQNTDAKGRPRPQNYHHPPGRRYSAFRKEQVRYADVKEAWEAVKNVNGAIEIIASRLYSSTDQARRFLNPTSGIMNPKKRSEFIKQCKILRNEQNK